MSQKLAEYEQNIKLRRTGAKQALKDFKAQQIELLTSIREVSSVNIAVVELFGRCNTVQERYRRVVPHISYGALS